MNGVSGVPGQPNVFYMGSVGGGVWKTTNAGRSWFPIFDSQPIASIGAIAVAPSAPDVVYVGTGEADMRSQIERRSRDANRSEYPRDERDLAATCRESGGRGRHASIRLGFRPNPPAGGRGGRGGGRGGLAPSAPGTYSVRLTASGKSYTQPLTIKADPRAAR